MALENGLFSEESFAADFGNDVVLFVHITSRIEGRENDDMLSQVGGNAFPTIMFLDQEGEVLGKHNGARSSEGFQSTRQAVVDMLAAKKKVDAGDNTAAAALLIAEIKLGKVDLDGAKSGYENLEELTDEEEETILGLINGLEFDAMMMKMRRRQLKPDAFFTAVKEMVENERIPTGPSSWQFWYSGVMAAALQQGSEDVALAKRALGVLEADPFFQGENAKYLKWFKDRIAELDK